MAGELTAEYRRKAQQAILEIKEELNDSIIIIDAAASEFITWTIGHQIFFQMVKEPSSLYQLEHLLSPETRTNMKFPEGLQKLVFFLGGRMLWAYKEGISNILEKNGQNIKECIIYSSFSEVAHSFVNSTSSNASNVASSNNPFRILSNEFARIIENSWKKRINKDKSSSSLFPISALAAVIHLPILNLQLYIQGTNAILVPSSKEYASALIKSSATSITSSSSSSNSSNEKIVGIADSLISILRFLNLKEHLFSMGSVSSAVAGVMTQLHKSILANRIDPPPSLSGGSSADPDLANRMPAALLLVDRVYFLFMYQVIHQTLDLAGPFLHSDNLMDRIQNAMPISLHSQVKKRKSNMQVDLSSFLSTPSLPGNLAHFNTASIPSAGISLATTMIDTMLSKKEKETMNEMKKKLLDILTIEKITAPNITNRSSSTANIALQIHSLLLTLFTTSKDGISSINYSTFFKYNHLLQVCLSVTQVFNIPTEVFGPRNSVWDELISLEKILIMSFEDRSQSILSRVIELLNQLNDNGDFKFGLKDIMKVLICMMSLVPASSTDVNSHDLRLSEAHFPMKEIADLEESIASRIQSYFGLNDQYPRDPMDISFIESDLSWFTSFCKRDGKLDLIQSMKELQGKKKHSIEEKKTEFFYEKKQILLEMKDKLHEYFSYLADISRSRSSLNLSTFKNLIRTSNTGTSSYVSILQQIVNYLIEEKNSQQNSTKQEMTPDLHYVEPSVSSDSSSSSSKPSSGVGSWLRTISNVSTMLLKSKPKPTESPIIILMFLGGVTITELRDARDLFKEVKQKNITLLVGSDSVIHSDTFLADMGK